MHIDLKRRHGSILCEYSSQWLQLKVGPSITKVPKNFPEMLWSLSFNHYADSEEPATIDKVPPFYISARNIGICHYFVNNVLNIYNWILARQGQNNYFNVPFFDFLKQQHFHWNKLNDTSSAFPFVRAANTWRLRYNMAGLIWQTPLGNSPWDF